MSTPWIILWKDAFTRCESHTKFISMAFTVMPLMTQLLQCCQLCRGEVRPAADVKHCWQRRKLQTFTELFDSIVKKKEKQQNSPHSFTFLEMGEKNFSKMCYGSKAFWIWFNIFWTFNDNPYYIVCDLLQNRQYMIFYSDLYHVWKMHEFFFPSGFRLT